MVDKIKEIKHKIKESKEKDWKSSLYLCLDLEEKMNFYSSIILPGLEVLSKSESIKKDDLTSLKVFIQNEIESELKYKDKTYSLPPSLHITTYYRGRGKYDENNLAYKQFVEGKVVSLTVPGVIFIPGRIVTSIAFPEAFSNNDFPHITSILGTYKAVDSNSVCNRLFSEGGSLSAEYKEKFSNIKESVCFETKIKVFNDEETAYVCLFKSESHIKLESVMKARWQ